MRNKIATAVILGTALSLAPVAAHATDTHPEHAAYIYVKTDPALPAAWENSGPQTLIKFDLGHDWYDSITVAEVEAVFGPICGRTDLAVQQDKGQFSAGFVWPTNIEYPVDNIGWQPNGPLDDAQHSELSSWFTIPACPPAQPPAVPYSKIYTTETCDTVTTYVATGEYLFTLVDGEWKRDAEPSNVQETSSIAPKEPSECVTPTSTPEPREELAHTGFEPWHIWLAVAGAILVPLGLMLTVFARAWRRNHLPRHRGVQK